MRYLVLIAVLFCQSCASVVDGTLESAELLVFTSKPTGAAIQSEGQTLCVTPCQYRVSRGAMRSLYATLEGRRPVRIDVQSDFNATTLGNVIAGGVGGVALDALSGRSVRYEDSVFIEFTAIED